MKRLLIVAAILACTASSCDKTGRAGEKDNPRKDITLTTKQTAFVESGNRFAFEFLNKVNSSETKDYMISPLSMQFLLGMILQGAEGQTAQEISSVLGYGEDGSAEVNDYCLAMLSQLPSVDKATKLSIANAIIMNDECTLRKSYKETVGKYYKAEVANKDFHDVKGTAKYINDWCSSHTQGMIPKILDEVSPDMMGYLLNAIYFKSKWSSPFHKEDSFENDFKDEAGAKAKVTMMCQEKEMRHYSGKEFNAVQLPYGNGAFTMTVMLPCSGYKVADVCSFLKTVSWADFSTQFGYCRVNLWLPRFETEYKIKLNDILSDMGMPSSFHSGTADFKAMSEYALCLSLVQQDAIIKVDEEGTEAAAVSHAGIATSVGPGANVVFHANRPFLYLITETGRGTILFAGRYNGK